MQLVDARRALLQRLFDHAPLFPPASRSLPDALEEDRRAQASPDAWLLGRFVVPEGTTVEGRELAVVGVGRERQGDLVFVEGGFEDSITLSSASRPNTCLSRIA